MPTPVLDSDDFAAQIEADYHRTLLESGNLLPKKPTISWSDENRWESKGYLAQVLRTSCACGAITESLTGIFYVSETPSGKRRMTALDLGVNLQFPLETPSPVQVQEQQARFCAYCLPSKGFERF
jgi:hypothetical protein